ncbi:MAG: hypothetical protein L3J68_04185 [Thermoplasmata archaeon]|nr:hypothetical protein [Thermoplasmata archaeon]
MTSRNLRGVVVVAVVLLCLGSTLTGTAASIVGTHAIPGVAPPGALGPTGPSSVAPSYSATDLNWTNLSIPDSASPPPRISASMVFDANDGYGLLFGGEYLNTSSFHYQYYNDTWSYKGGVWTNRTTTVSPSPRFGFGLADDPEDSEVVLFGGDGANGAYLNDTWTWSAGVWTNITASAGTAPPEGFWMSMAYDAATLSVLLFGGINHTSQYGNDTWSFAGGKWTQLFPTTLPSGRHAQEMTFDSGDNEMVMFGGLGAVDYLNDTWTFRGGNWAPIAPGNHPDARIAAGMAFDTAQEQLVLYGGYPAADDYYSTWLFSEGSWLQYNVSNSPPNPNNPYGQMFYDPVDDYTFLFYEVNSNGPIMGNWAFNFTSMVTPLTASLQVNPGTVPVGGSATLTTTASGGTGSYSYLYSTLPPGCATGNRSAISCTPTAVGDYVVGVNVTDTADREAAAVATLDVTAVVVTLTANLTADPGTVVVNESTTLTVKTSGVLPANLTYFYTGLPAGCASSDLAVLTCTPTEVGAFTPRVEVHDQAGHFANATTSLTVTSPNSPASTSGSLWLWLVIALVVVAAVVLIVFIVRRRRKAAGAIPASPPPTVPMPPPPSP